MLSREQRVELYIKNLNKIKKSFEQTLHDTLEIVNVPKYYKDDIELYLRRKITEEEIKEIEDKFGIEIDRQDYNLLNFINRKLKENENE